MPAAPEQLIDSVCSGHPARPRWRDPGPALRAPLSHPASAARSTGGGLAAGGRVFVEMVTGGRVLVVITDVDQEPRG